MEPRRRAVPASLLVTGQLLAAHSGGRHGLRILILVLIVVVAVVAIVLISRSRRRRGTPPAAGDGR
jgi:hypothetical protein